MPQWIEVTRSPEYSPKLIGQELAFLQNDFRGLLSDLGDAAFMDKIEKAMLGETIIIGGYLNTQLIASNAIVTRHIQAGAITADKIAANSITTDKIDSNSITADKIASNAITTQHIQAGAITANKLDVQTLSAISANLGEVTSGIITGATIRTSASGDRIQLDSSRLRAYLAMSCGCSLILIVWTFTLNPRKRWARSLRLM